MLIQGFEWDNTKNMKVQLNVFAIVPSQTSSLIEKVGVTDTIGLDVSSFTMDENRITLHFNNGPDEIIPLRSNNGVENEDWRGASIFVTRQFLELDMKS